MTDTFGNPFSPVMADKVFLEQLPCRSERPRKQLKHEVRLRFKWCKGSVQQVYWTLPLQLVPRSESRPPDIATAANVRLRAKKALDLARPQDDAEVGRQRMARQIESHTRWIWLLDGWGHVCPATA